MHDRFVQVTEGVIADEALGLPRARGRRRRSRCATSAARRSTLRAQRRPPRAAAHRARGPRAPRARARGRGRAAAPGARVGRARRRSASPGSARATRCASTTPGARSSSAPTAPTPAPTARPTCSTLGGIPQGDYAPAPWLQSSRGYARLAARRRQRHALRARRAERAVVDARGAPGRCALHLLTDPTPAARLRRYLRADRAARRCCPSGATASGSPATSTRTRTTSRRTSTAAAGTASRSTRSCSTRRGRRNTTPGSPTRTSSRTSPGWCARLRAAGVRTVVWVTPWVNLESLDGQIPPDPASRAPAPRARAQLRRGRRGRPLRPRRRRRAARRALVDGHRLAGRLHRRRPPRRGGARRPSARCALGVEGIKADDGEGYYFPDDVRFADGTHRRAGRVGATAALYRRSMQRALDEVHGPGRGVLFGRSGWTGQQATGDAVGRRPGVGLLVAARRSSPRRIAAAAQRLLELVARRRRLPRRTRLVERCPTELLAALGAARLLHAADAGARALRAGAVDLRRARRSTLYRGYVLLHEHARARTCAPPRPRAARCGPADRAPAARCSTPATSAAGRSPTPTASARRCGSRRCSRRARASARSSLPRGDWIETWSGARVRGGARGASAPAPLHAIPVWVRAGSIVVTYPAEHVAAGWATRRRRERPLDATLWGEPRCGRAVARLADGTRRALAARALVGARPGGRDLQRALARCTRRGDARSSAT